jgi:glycosyltransferase involved in cell wall biosynthesis
LRVAFLDTVPTPYRAPLYDLLQESGDFDFRVLFCTGAHDRAEWSQLALDFPNEVLPGWSFKTGRGGNVSSYHFNPGVLRTLGAYKPDAVVISGWGQTTFLLAARWAKRRGLPYILVSESHALHQRARLARAYRAAVVSRVVRGAAASLATGTLAREYLAQLGADPRGIFIRPNACDVDRFARDATEARASGAGARLRVELAGDLPLIIFIGRLIPVKGVDVLLKALQQLELAGKPIACAIVGDGPERDALQRQARALQSCRVTFAGARRPDDLADMHAAADALCLPSFDESWGVVVNEAMSAGLPVVVSDAVGAGPDLVAPGRTGEVFRRGDSHALAAALLRALELRPPVEEATRTVADWGYPRAAAGTRSALQHALQQDSTR